MFEKEAEEAGNEKIKENHQFARCARKSYKDGFRDGATFGYNKANEWHYVKDGDLPKVGQKCYFIYSNLYGEGNKVIFSEASVNVITGVYAFFIDEETGEETTEPCFYDEINDDEICLKEVYAWKEITLPKEMEEND